MTMRAVMLRGAKCDLTQLIEGVIFIYISIMTRDHNYFVYIIECADGLYYTGITNNLERRIFEHNEGSDPKSFTFNEDLSF